MDGSAPPAGSGHGTRNAKGAPAKVKDSFNVIEAPETQRFNSPLPAAGNDTRKGPTKLGKFHDMTAKGSAGTKRAAEAMDAGDLDDDDDDDEEGGGGGKRKFSNKRNATSTGRRKIDIEYIEDKSKRHVSFTKRKAGLMKKAYELSTLTGTNCLVLVVSETGLVYTYATPGLKPVIAHEDGKAVIAASLRGDLKVDENEAAKTTSKRRKNAPKSKSASTEPEEEEDDQILEGGEGDDLPMDSNGQHQQPQEQQHHLALPLPDLHHHLGHQQHPMFPHDDGMMDPALRYLGDFNLFPNVSSAAGTSPNPLTTASLPPLPYNPLPDASHHAFTLPPYRPSMTAEAPPMPHEQQPHQPQSNPTFQQQQQHQTAFDRATAEHAQAFASFQAKTTTPYLAGRPAPGVNANITSSLGGSHGQPLHGAHEFGDAARNWLPNLIKEKEGAIVSGPMAEEGMEERRKAWRLEATQALVAAAKDRTIKTFINAHTYSLKANLAIPPPRNTVTKPKAGIELTLEHFRVMCEENNIEGLEFLGPASKAFIDTYLPNNLNYTQKMLNEAQQHIFLFYDYLESHDLISAKQYDALSKFDSPSMMLHSRHAVAEQQQAQSRAQDAAQDPGAIEETPGRVMELQVQLPAWSEQCAANLQNRFASDGGEIGVDGTSSVEGWFEVFRVRQTFALLKERDLQGDAATNLALSPFKVRFPPHITPLLKVEDMIWLKLRKVLPRDNSTPGRRPHSRSQSGLAEGFTWAPIQSGPVHASLHPPSNTESADVDSHSVSAELDSMLLAKTDVERTEEDNSRICQLRGHLGVLERAAQRLAEGELRD